jgi:hypothetical protein
VATKKKPRQQRIPGTEEPSVPAIDQAAETYYDAKNARIKLSEEEKEAKESLIEVMLKEGLTRYITADGLVVDITNKSNVKCKKKGDAESGADSNGDGEE